MVSACEFPRFSTVSLEPKTSSMCGHTAQCQCSANVGCFRSSTGQTRNTDREGPQWFLNSDVPCVPSAVRSSPAGAAGSVICSVSLPRPSRWLCVLLHLSRIVVGQCIPCIRLLLGWVPDEVAVWYVWSGQTGRKKQGGKKRVVFKQVWTSQCKLRDVWQL